jgi:carbon storage regulator
MLILSRKEGEKIIINGDIEITVTSIKGNEVKLGIKAPDSVAVYREEVYTKVLEENKKAASSNVPDLSKLMDKAKNK